MGTGYDTSLHLLRHVAEPGEERRRVWDGAALLAALDDVEREDDGPAGHAWGHNSQSASGRQLLLDPMQTHREVGRNAMKPTSQGR